MTETILSEKSSLAIPDKVEREKILKQLLALYRPKQRQRTQDKRLAKMILSLLQGYGGERGRCELCLGEGYIETDLTLHHRAKNSINDNRIENLALLHLSCNVKVEHNPMLLPSVSSPPGERENVGVGLDATVVLKDVVDYQRGSVEMQVNDRVELPYRNWVRGVILRDGRVEKGRAIDGGAEEVGSNPTTTRKYLGKMRFAKDWGLREFKDPRDHLKYLTFTGEVWQRLRAEGTESRYLLQPVT